jgi:nicotinamide mononucleotide adenylyltransferase
MKTIGIYPGNFQPPTRAHLEVYKKLRHVVGPDTFVVTTDRTPTQEAPLNFGDKEQVWVRHGLPASHIRKVDDWKHPLAIFNNFPRNHTKVIYALNPKEAEEIAKRKARLGQVDKNKLTEPPKAPIHEFIEPRQPEHPDTDSEEDEEDPEKVFTKTHPEQDENKEVWLDTEGKLNYFQPYKGNEHTMKPLSEHGYVLIIDDTRIEGKPVSTANIRQVLGSPRYEDNEKKKFFRFIFGWFDVGLYTLMTSKFRQAHQVSIPDEERAVSMPSMASMVRGSVAPKSPVPNPQAPLRKESKVKSQLQKMVREMLGEIMDEEYSTSINEPDSSTNMTAGTEPLKSPAQQRSDAQKAKVDLVKQKKEAEAKAKENRQRRDQYSTTVKSYDSFQKKNDRDSIDAINKKIADTSSSRPGMSAGGLSSI